MVTVYFKQGACGNMTSFVFDNESAFLQSVTEKFILIKTLGWVTLDHVDKIILPPERDDFANTTTFYPKGEIRVTLRDGNVLMTTPPSFWECRTAFIVLLDSERIVWIPTSNVARVQEM